MKKGNLIVGLDVGSTKSCAVVGEVYHVRKPRAHVLFQGTRDNGEGPAHGQVDIIGIGSSPSDGLRKGEVVNIESTVESIIKAVEEAGTMAGVEIKAVHAGIAGGHIHGFTSHGVIAIKEKEISQREIDRVIDAAKAVAIPLDREVLHVVPVGFTVDGQNGINDPRGMSGVRLEADVRVITGAVTAVQNLFKSCQKAGLEVIDVVPGPLSSAEATLSREEKELGVGIVDIGGGTTDIALFHRGSICHITVLSIGGNNFTNDIAIGLRVPASEAERLKKTYGCSQMSMIRQDEVIEVIYPGDKPGRKIPKQHLIEILQPRAEELFSLVKEEILKSGLHGVLASGIVLTGGAVLMQGMDVMAENVLELPVRIGSPAGFGGITDIAGNPLYAAGIGLVLHSGREIMCEQGFDNANLINGMTMKMKEWAKGVFTNKNQA